MTAKRKITDKNGVQVFPITHTKAVLDDNGNSVEQRLQENLDLINQKQLEVGAVPSDITPTAGSSNWVTSGGLFNATTLENNVEIDLTQYTAVRAYPNPDIWVVSSSAYPYYGMFIPVKAGQKYLITANSEAFALYGFLTTNTYSHNANVSYATGCTRVTVPVGETVIDTAPSDAKYIWICTYTTADRTPDMFVEYHKMSIKDYLNNTDATPTEDSVNLVTSGGVYEAVQDVRTEIDDRTTIVNTSENIISGKTAEPGVINSSGTWTSNSSSWTAYFITVAAGDTFLITANSSNDAWWKFLPDSSHTHGSVAVVIKEGVIEASMSSTVIVPDGATCMWIYCNGGGTDRTPLSIYKKRSIKESVEDLNDAVTSINNSSYAVVSTTTLTLTCNHSTSAASYKQSYNFAIGKNYRITLSVDSTASEIISLVDLPKLGYTPWIDVMTLPTGSLSAEFIYTPSRVNGYLQAFSGTEASNGKAVTAVIEELTTLQDVNDILLSFKESASIDIDTNSENIAKIEDQVFYESGMTYKSYTGNRITPNRIGFKPVGSLVTGQSAAVFGDVAFVFGAGGSLCTAYNMKTRTLIKNSVYINGAPSREDRWHCNSSEFGTNYYAEGDAFPLLYIGGGQGDAIHELLVCRVMPDASRVYHLDVVQVLTMPNEWGYANVAFDEERGKIILCDNHMIFRVCNPPAVVDGEGNPISTYTFTEEDVEQTITIDASSLPVPQDAAMHRGLLYLGNEHTDDAFFRVIDLYNGTIVNDINIEGWFTDAAEGYSFYNEHLYIFGAANIYKIWFM